MGSPTRTSPTPSWAAALLAAHEPEVGSVRVLGGYSAVTASVRGLAGSWTHRPGTSRCTKSKSNLYAKDVSRFFLPLKNLQPTTLKTAPVITLPITQRQYILRPVRHTTTRSVITRPSTMTLTATGNRPRFKYPRFRRGGLRTGPEPELHPSPRRTRQRAPLIQAGPVSVNAAAAEEAKSPTAAPPSCRPRGEQSRRAPERRPRRRRRPYAPRRRRQARGPACRRKAPGRR